MKKYKYWVVEHNSIIYPEYKYRTDAFYTYQEAQDKFNEPVPTGCSSSALIEYEVSEKIIESKSLS
jgi:hypothetical protein